MDFPISNLPIDERPEKANDSVKSNSKPPCNEGRSFAKAEEDIQEYIESKRIIVTGREKEEQLIGVETIIDRIKQAIIIPQIVNLDSKLTVQAILLAGLPGVGKTEILMASVVVAARELKRNISVFRLTYNDAQSSYVGESEKYIKCLFQVAAKHSPSVILADEVDGLMKHRKGNDSEHSSKFKSALLSEMQGFESNRGVLLVGSTNLPESMDKGYVRRFQERLIVRTPTSDQRKLIFQKYLQRAENACKIEWDTIDYDYFEKNTHGRTGDDIRNIVGKAVRDKICTSFRSDHSRRHRKPQLSMVELQLAMNEFKSETDPTKISDLETWARTNDTTKRGETVCRPSRKGAKKTLLKVLKTLCCAVPCNQF